jgi:hypothetical protein
VPCVRPTVRLCQVEVRSLGCECTQPFEGLRQLGTGFFKSRHPHQPILAPPSPQPPGCYSQFDSKFPLSPPKARAPMPDRKVHHCIFAAVPRQAGLLRSLQFHIAGHVSVVPAMQTMVCAIACRTRRMSPRAVKHPPRSSPCRPGRFHRRVASSPFVASSLSPAAGGTLLRYPCDLPRLDPSAPSTWRCGKKG